MVSDSINWLWNNPVTREVARYPQVVGDLLWAKKRVTGPVVKEVITKVVEVLPANMLVIPKSARIFVRLAGLSGAAAVALGAYGAHVFYQRPTSEDLKQVYETANRYHFLHTIALLSVPLCRKPKLAGTLFAGGMLIFCGSCYYYALTGNRSVRQYTPYGGMMLIAGWLALVL
uniref:Transmembrane protein 256 homolog n=1 Tax=Hirondellea gigas TaxID=1518452 RepID=A0A2P2HYC2_9CRUS